MNNELYHHGVPGQKWFVRRYQYADGSLTPLGRRRLERSNTAIEETASARAKEHLEKSQSKYDRAMYKEYGGNYKRRKEYQEHQMKQSEEYDKLYKKYRSEEISKLEQSDAKKRAVATYVAAAAAITAAALISKHRNAAKDINDESGSNNNSKTKVNGDASKVLSSNTIKAQMPKTDYKSNLNIYKSSTSTKQTIDVTKNAKIQDLVNAKKAARVSTLSNLSNYKAGSLASSKVVAPIANEPVSSIFDLAGSNNWNAGGSYGIFHSESSKNQNELYHYNILGSHWGVRRFQTKDGKLTEEGKKRYRKTMGDAAFEKAGWDKDIVIGENNLINHETTYQTNYGKMVDAINTNENRNIKEIKNIANETSNALRTASNAIPNTPTKKIRTKTYDEMSTQELKDKINRIETENKYADLVGDVRYQKAGSTYVKETLGYAGSIAAVAASATAIVMAADTIYRNHHMNQYANSSK